MRNESVGRKSHTILVYDNKIAYLFAGGERGGFFWSKTDHTAATASTAVQ